MCFYSIFGANVGVLVWDRSNFGRILSLSAPFLHSFFLVAMCPQLFHYFILWNKGPFYKQKLNDKVENLLSVVGRSGSKWSEQKIRSTFCFKFWNSEVIFIMLQNGKLKTKFSSECQGLKKTVFLFQKITWCRQFDLRHWIKFLQNLEYFNSLVFRKKLFHLKTLCKGSCWTNVPPGYE